MFVRMAAVALAAVTAFVLGLVVVRVLRRQMVEGSNIGEDLGPETWECSIPVHRGHPATEAAEIRAGEREAGPATTGEDLGAHYGRR